MSEFKLCYVSGQWAYFTTNALDKQRGDDWNDAPYEHNAEAPYEWRDYMRASGVEPYEICKVAFSANLDAPNDGVLNSRYSVEDINNGAVPWLYERYHPKERKPVVIPAGTLLEDFIRLVQSAGGTVYAPVTEQAKP